VSKLAGTTSRALRHYEDLGLIRPDRSPGNARLYSQSQIDLACMIAELRRFGVGIQEITKVIDAAAGGDRRAMTRVMMSRLADLRWQQQALEAALRGIGGPI
jgi:DNA-binding transcriptional MerR regulator